MLLFMDGMAHYDTARIAAKYSAVEATNVTWSITAEGRFGNCLTRLALTNASQQGLVIAPLTTRLGPWTPPTGGVCGFAIKVDDLSKIGGDVGLYDTLLMILEGGKHHVRIALNRNGTFTLCRYPGAASEGGSGPTILAQSSEGLTNNTWLFVECKWVIHATAGSVEIRVNGVPVLTYSGNTRETDPTFASLGVWNAVRLVSIGSTNVTPRLTLRLCDLYLADLASTLTDDVHDFLGDGTIVTIMPNAPGDTAGCTPFPAATPNWDTVNDRPSPDDDATYVAATASGTRDLYHFENIPAGSIVRAAHVNILARKETEGTATIAPLVQPPGSGPLTGPTQGVANILYDRYLTQAYDLNPASGVKFTDSDINTGQFGLVKTG